MTMENLFLHVNIRGKRPFPRIVSEAVKIIFPPISTCLNFHTAWTSNLQPSCQGSRARSRSGDDSASCLPACIHCARKPQWDTSEGPSRRQMGVLCAFRLNLHNLFCSEWALKGCYVISTHSHSYINVSSQINYCFIRLLICSILMGGLTSHSLVEIPCYSGSISIKSLEKETIMSWQT